MNRFTAGGLHFLISAFIATTVFLIVFFLWYPDALFDRAGGKDLFLIIAGVDVTIGPLMTFIIFKRGKRGLRFDLAFIAFAQIVALSYGTWVLFQARPAYVVFVKDRFELARANDIAPAELARAKPPYDRLPVLGPKLVAADMPTDPNEQFRIITSAMSGLDVQGFPQYYRAYDDLRADVVAHAAPFPELRKYNGEAEVAAVRAHVGRDEGKLGFLPMRAGPVDLAVIVDPQTADVLYIAALRPWKY